MNKEFTCVVSVHGISWLLQLQLSSHITCISPQTGLQEQGKSGTSWKQLLCNSRVLCAR